MSREPLSLEMPTRERRSRSAFIVSVIIHVIVVFGLLNIVFRYDFSGLIGVKHQPKVTPERIIYVPVGTEGGGSGGAASAPGATKPPQEAAQRTTRLVAPSRVPSTLPPVPSRPSDGGSGGGVGGGRGEGVGPGSAAAGVRPGYDSRLWVDAAPYTPLPKTQAERVDSTIKAAFGVYEDSVRFAQEHPQRAPGDWTRTDKNGRKWGWDQGAIRLGKFMIPNALLAMLPVNATGNPQMLERARHMSAARADIMYQANRAEGGDEFKKAVERIRARREKERAEQQKSRAQGGGGDSPAREPKPASPASP